MRGDSLTNDGVGGLFTFELHEGVALWFTARLTKLVGSAGDDIELQFDNRVTIAGSRFGIAEACASERCEYSSQPSKLGRDYLTMSSRALLVLDPQRVYVDDGAALQVEGAREVIARINQLVRSFERKRELIILTRHAHRPDGSDLGRMFDYSGSAEEPNFIDGTAEVEFAGDLYIPPNAKVLTKRRYSAFSNPELVQILATSSTDTVVICGFMTNYCCETTARDAHDRDYFVDFVMDATGCPPLEDVSQELIKKVTTATLEGGFARVVTTAQLA